MTHIIGKSKTPFEALLTSILTRPGLLSSKDDIAGGKAAALIQTIAIAMEKAHMRVIDNRDMMAASRIAATTPAQLMEMGKSREDWTREQIRAFTEEAGRQFAGLALVRQEPAEVDGVPGFGLQMAFNVYCPGLQAAKEQKAALESAMMNEPAAGTA